MILYLNPTSGLSGDMLLGALLGLGAPLDAVKASVASTGLTGWSLEAVPVVRGGLTATRALVTVPDQPSERRASDLIAMAATAKPHAVAARAVHCLSLLASVEGALHGVDPAEVHLHELGGDDTLIDIVSVAAAVEALEIDAVHSGPLALGTGTVETRHGRLPVPAPATSALLEGALVHGAGERGETVTPTGAALVKSLGTSYEPLPLISVVGTAYGAGSREGVDRPNVLQAILGETSGTRAMMSLLECTVDDASGEFLGTALTDLVAAGAADVWITPAVMKKSRPGHVVHVLCDRMLTTALEADLLRLTGSLGVRRSYVDRLAVDRSEVVVHVHGHPVRVKRGPWTAKPEHDDVLVAARALGLTARQVQLEAMILARD